MCGFAVMKIFEVVKCGEILPILSAGIMGKMRMWQFGDTLRLLGAIEIHCNRAVYVSLNTNANPDPNPNPKLIPSPNRTPK